MVVVVLGRAEDSLAQLAVVAVVSEVDVVLVRLLAHEALLARRAKDDWSRRLLQRLLRVGQVRGQDLLMVMAVLHFDWLEGAQRWRLVLPLDKLLLELLLVWTGALL